MSNNWLDLYSTSNRFIRTYVQGFVDISGGNLIVRNNDVSFNNRLVVGSDITTNKRLFTVGDTSHNGNLFVAYDTSLNSRLVVGSDVTINKRLFTRGDSSLNGNLFAAYDTSLNSRLVVGSDTTVNKRLFAGGDASFSGNLYVGSMTASSSNTTGALIVNGGVGVNGNIWFPNNGSGLVWGSTFSQIMDDGDLKIRTDDNMRLYTNNTERITINTNGNVGISTTSPTQALEVNGTIRVNAGNNSYNKLFILWDAAPGDAVSGATNFYGLGINGGTLRYQVPSTGDQHKFYCGTTLAAYISNTTVTSTNFNATSDYRIKANVKTLNDTHVIDYLNPVVYYNTNSKKQDIGFIAHEVQQQFPFLVTGEKDGSEYQTLNYNGLIGILTKEIQDLKKEVKEIRRELASYKH
jgi:hypothetical protein